MKRYGFSGKEAEPSDLFSAVKKLLEDRGFIIEGETVREGFWDIRAARKDIDKIVAGRVRDADVVISGTKGKFEIQLKVGIWGRDLAVPVIEGVATIGASTAANLHEEHMTENEIWKEIVRLVDPSLFVCDRCGMIFKTREELEKHKEYEKHRLANNLRFDLSEAASYLMEYVPEYFGAGILWI